MTVGATGTEKAGSSFEEDYVESEFGFDEHFADDAAANEKILKDKFPELKTELYDQEALDGLLGIAKGEISGEDAKKFLEALYECCKDTATKEDDEQIQAIMGDI